MTDARTGNLIRRALAEVAPPVRTTTVGRRTLAEISPDVHTTDVARRVLAKVHADMVTTTIVRRVLGDAVPCSTKWTHIGTITRADGTIHRFTTKDTDLVYGGQTYYSCGAFSPSATESSNEAGDFGNMQLTGLISSGAITVADLDARRLDGALFEEWEVPWDGSAETPKLIQKGRWGRVEYSKEKGYQAELLGDGALLMQSPLVQPITATCRWKDNIRDARCPVSDDLASFTVTGTVEEGLGARSFLDSARTEAADYFAFGTVTFTSGANEGVSAEIRANQDGVFTLWPHLAAPIAAGDEYTMIAGCDQTKATCQTKFDAYIGFGGFFDVPGQDKVGQQPTAH